MALVSVKIEDLRGLIALSRVDKNLVGDQIRKAVAAYLENRKDEIDNEIELMKKEEVSMLDSLMGEGRAE